MPLVQSVVLYKTLIIKDIISTFIDPHPLFSHALQSVFFARSSS